MEVDEGDDMESSLIDREKVKLASWFHMSVE
jgi:hypothetical protein